MKDMSTVLAEKLSLEEVCFRLSKELIEARSTIKEQEKLIADFKRCNRYHKGHSDGYAEASRKYRTP